MKKICVYCGSSSGINQVYLEAATSLGKELASQNIELIYGGANVGLMGTIADAVLANNGKVTGIMPRTILDKREIAHKGLTELIAVNSMHERKQIMSDRADGFIAMPGGFGTIDEVFEIITWLQLGVHTKHVGFYNINTYYDKLMDFVSHTVQEGFVRKNHQDMIFLDSNPCNLINSMKTFDGLNVSKWKHK